jgi:hypothetical protein
MSRPIAASATSSGGAAGGSVGDGLAGCAEAVARGLFFAADFFAGAVLVLGWAIGVPLVTQQ